MAVREALGLLCSQSLRPSPTPAEIAEARAGIDEASVPGVRVLALDSNALVTAADAGHVIVTGSHGGLLGGRPATAVKHPVCAALYNDAGISIDQAGISRLPVLAAHGIAAATVSAMSAEIGDAMSTFRTGIISAINDVAARHGAAIGQPVRALVCRLVAARQKELPA